MIQRRPCRKIRVGSVEVGGDAPITVQSMTNTLTHDVDATVAQILALEAAGIDIVRVSCPDEDSSAALKQIVPRIKVPLVADIHFHYKRGVEAAQNGHRQNDVAVSAADVNVTQDIVRDVPDEVGEAVELGGIHSVNVPGNCPATKLGADSTRSRQVAEHIWQLSLGRAIGNSKMEHTPSQ